MFKQILKYRRDQERVVDQRVRLLGEILGSIRAVKLYAYENHFEGKVSSYREQELVRLRHYGFFRSAVNATFEFIPVLAAVCESFPF